MSDETSAEVEARVGIKLADDAKAVQELARQIRMGSYAIGGGVALGDSIDAAKAVLSSDWLAAYVQTARDEERERIARVEALIEKEETRVAEFNSRPGRPINPVLGRPYTISGILGTQQLREVLDGDARGGVR